jgi:hypothetical protein
MDIVFFRALVSNSTAWIDTGRRLLSAADLIWPEVRAAFAILDSQRARPPERAEEDVCDTRMRHALACRLLAAYAIDNLLKGLRVRRLA